MSAFRPRGRVHPFSARALFRREGVPAALLNCCLQVSYTAFSAFLPLWAIGRGVGNPGLLFISAQGGTVISRLFGGRLADRLGTRAVVAPAMLGTAAALAATSAAADPSAFLVLACTYGLCYGLCVVVLLSVAAEASPPEARSAVMNTYGFGSDVAQLLGPWGLGLAAGAWGLSGALILAGATPLVGALAYLAIRPAPAPARPDSGAPSRTLPPSSTGS